MPFQPALVFPAGRDRQGRAQHIQLNFQQLNQLCDRYAYGLAEYGISQGDRVLLLIRPGIEFVAVTFALLKMGAVPVIIDPGMGRKAFLQCVAETEPTVLIGVPLAHVLRTAFPKPFRTVRRRVTVGKRWFWGGTTLDRLQSRRCEPFPVAATTTEDEAAVAFTSGSTGIPKGVVYSHGIFQTQVNLLREEMNFREGEVHLAGLYIFALFNPVLGITTIIPDMDPRQPAKLNPAYFVESIQTYGVTITLGSPTIFRIVGQYCLAHNIRLPSLKQVLMFGAAVRPSLIEQFSALMDSGQVFTPYGATEALPLTLIGQQEILSETGRLTKCGAGVCVGRPLGDAILRIIPVTDEPIPAWDDSLPLPPGQLGEVVVKGLVVTGLYLNRPQKTAEAKIYEADGSIWHRMGDVGYFDDKGRLWICGRKSHRVETSRGTLLPLQCEAIFNQHPAVARTALVGVGLNGRQRPILIVEPKPGLAPVAQAKQKLINELLALGNEHEHTRHIKDVMFRDSFPVDVRHNAKIQREKLALWAEKQLA